MNKNIDKIFAVHPTAIHSAITNSQIITSCHRWMAAGMTCLQIQYIFMLRCEKIYSIQISNQIRPSYGPIQFYCYENGGDCQ